LCLVRDGRSLAFLVSGTLTSAIQVRHILVGLRRNF
jgi:hypothetical protein